MTYRDRPILCPVCRCELARDGTRERWQCGRCRGVFIGVGELADALARLAPSLRPDDGVRGLTTPARRVDRRRPEAPRGAAADPVPSRSCAVCSAEMSPVFLAGLEVERCLADDHLWLDGGEIDAVAARATGQHTKEVDLISRIVRALRW